MKDRLCQNGTIQGYLEVENLQLTTAFQPAIIPLVAQVTAALGWVPAVPLKTTLLEKAREPKPDFMNDFNAYCGVFLSLRTGVVERVRLRDVVAFCASSRLVGAAVYERQDSLNELIPMLMSEVTVEDWFLQKPKNQATSNEQLGKTLDEITRQVLRLLATSGISRKKPLILMWPGGPESRYETSRQVDKWLPILSDTATTSTFACVIPTCRETEECKCPMAQSSVRSPQAVEWKLPEHFRLKTTLRALVKTNHNSANPQDQIPLVEGKIYWINDPKLKLVSRVIGVSKRNNDKPVFYLSVRPTLVPGRLMKHFAAYRMMRESTGGPHDCVLGSGESFER